MNVLLDTHVLVWAAADDPQLSGRAALIVEADRRFVSAASAYEIAYKTRLGRLPGGRSMIDGWPRLLGQLQAEELPLSVAHMRRAGELDWAHRDPFDRMLVAQAQLEGLAVITDDRAMRAFSDVRTVGE